MTSHRWMLAAGCWAAVCCQAGHSPTRVWACRSGGYWCASVWYLRLRYKRMATLQAGGVRDHPAVTASPGLSRSRICLKCRRREFNPWVGKILWKRAWQPTPEFLPAESHGQRSLVSYTPWGQKEWDQTEVT